ncbi:KAE1 threonylcarbamoyltransferase, partial [Urocynchramus pylzowi]|nr:KAE1 threonylcarbamoyltransferase [Urocynchramus pylzowi]
QVIAYARRRYRILGETLDLAVGNCIDRLARLLQIPNAPSPGYNVEQLAKSFSHFFPIFPPFFPPYFPPFLPRFCPVFGLIGAVFGWQETAFAMLAEVTERALALTRARHLLLVGGVAC